MSRRDEIEQGLTAVRDRIVSAAAAGGRDPSQITLVVITKTKPVEDLRLLASLGVRDIGENKDQEAAAKAAVLAAEDVDLHWHFVGQLQTNKVASVCRYADVVHSVDRRKLVGSLDRHAAALDRRIGAFVQVNLTEDPARGGAAPDEALSLCEAVAVAEALDLMGLMAVAPLGEDPAASFGRLAVLSDTVSRVFPSATSMSAGMSGDLEAAIAAGATHVRVGSAVMGERGYVR